MLLDLDAFFASVEQLDHPEWRGKPVIVGGSADKRGVVSTCSYEARTYGVRSAMPASTARRLCPDAIWTSGHFDRYREMSNKVMDIMLNESPFLQQVSIDEAFLDITPTPHASEDPIAIATRIQNAVDALGISCSIGLGVSKSVAKIASDFDKPHGLTVVYPGREADFLAPLPCKTMSGIGAVAQKKLAALGIHTLGDVVRADPTVLKPIFGKNVSMMQKRCCGADTDPVVTEHTTKSVSNEMSFAEDISSRKDIEAALYTVCAKVARRLRKKGYKASLLSIKIRFDDFSVRSMQTPLVSPTDNEHDFYDAASALLNSLWPEGRPVRLVGVATSGFANERTVVVQQDSLFEIDNVSEDEDNQSTHQNEAKRRLSSVTDMVRDRFGESAVLYGREMRTKDNLTGSSSKNPADYND